MEWLGRDRPGEGCVACWRIAGGRRGQTRGKGVSWVWQGAKEGLVLRCEGASWCVCGCWRQKGGGC